jgi:hypothetical protein
VELFDGHGFRWDVQRDGTILDGTDDAFEGGLQLGINHRPALFSFDATLEDGGQEIALRPLFDGQLQVGRKIYVSAVGSFARFLDTFINPTGDDVEARITIMTELGSEPETAVISTSTGDTIFSQDDDFIITDDVDGSGSPTVGLVFSGPGADIQPSFVFTNAPGGGIVSYTFETTISAGERVSLMHFATQTLTQASAQATADMLVHLNGDALDGLSDQELASILNFFALPDADGDRLSDAHEISLGTDPNNPDTDGGGRTDGDEVKTDGTDPLDPSDDTLD